MVINRVVIFGVAYSPNLGDGVISHTLNLLLKKIFGSEICIDNIDLAGRECLDEFDHPYFGIREYFIKYSKFIPRKLRRYLVTTYIKRSLSPKLKVWREKVKACDMVIIGGGNLFSDVDLNFPLKLSIVLKLAIEEQKRIFITSVGVNDNWSSHGRELIKTYINNDGVYFSCRDNSSCNLMRKMFSPAYVALLPDPAILLSRLHAPSTKVKIGKKRIGINVACPTNMAYSGDLRIINNNKLSIKFYMDLTKHFLERGFEVELFTNGAKEDRLFLTNFIGIIGLENKKLHVKKANNPLELIDIISGLDRLFSFRMHACIVGLSYGVPSYSIAWDTKIKSFYLENNLSDMLLENIMVQKGDSVAEIMLREKNSRTIVDSNTINAIEKAYTEFFKTIS